MPIMGGDFGGTGGTVPSGAFIPMRPWCIFPLFQIFPHISEKFSDFQEIFYNFTFSRKISWFSSAKISDDFFLVIDHKFPISPLFSLFRYISPCFAKIILSPYFYKFPPVLGKFTNFLHTLRVFRFPLLWQWCIYASPNARTGRPCIL